MIDLPGHRTAGKIFMLLAFAFIQISGVYAQERQSITGRLIERKSNQAIPYATVALIRVSDSAMINGATSDDNGMFIISPVQSGNYRLRISIIGYNPETRGIALENKGVTYAGTIYLEEKTVVLKEVEIFSDRVKAKSESDRTIFFMTKKMLDASSTGMDVLKLIPGIQVDLMQNISLEGSSNIQFFVNGKERDGGFISQLDPKQIDRVEVINKPSLNLDGNSTGAINIILKKDRDQGISGQIYAEIPCSLSEIYIRPNYSLNWGFKKLNLYTSYKGEMTYLDLHESTNRNELSSMGTNEITSNQYVRQKDWSQRFSFGIDYALNAHDQFNVYVFYNPYSRELDGNADLQISGILNTNWKAKKEDSDMNTGTFCSLFYKHNFNKEGRELTLEISNFHLKAKSSTTFVPEGNENSTVVQTNTTEPEQNVISTKMDYTTLIWNKLNFSTGIKTKFQVLQDDYVRNFTYNEQIFAAYGVLSYKRTKFDCSLGLRAEKSIADLKDTFRNSVLSFFPDVTFNYKPTSRQHIQLSYDRSIKRPNIYQLNPLTAIDDPCTVSKGNPFLTPEFRSTIFLDYSIQFKNNYIATRLFYNNMTDVINPLTFINDTGAFETQVHNMGTIQQYGVQLSGTVKLGIATINPYLRLFEQYTTANCLAKQYGVENRHDLAYESGLSAILSFKHDISFSLIFHYGSPKNDIQGNSFCDALYFLSLDKTFHQKIKIGIVCALPFTKSFIYNGSETDGSNFYSHYQGNVKISSPFCWLKLCYQFNQGKNRDKINHAGEEIENLPKKGF
jgi:hypothetical protein